MTKSPKGRKRATARKSSPKPTAPVSPKTKQPISNIKPKYAAFVDNFMVHYNGTRAAIEAGYSARSAATIAHRMLRIDDIAAEITRRRAALAENLQNVSLERYKREVAAVAFSNMQGLAPMFGDGTPAEKLALLSPDQAAAVAEITVEEFRDGRSDYRQVRRTKFKLHSKDRGLELMGRVNGWIRDKVDHNHQHQGLIIHALLKEIAAAQSGRPIVEIEDEAEAPAGAAA